MRTPLGHLGTGMTVLPLHVQFGDHEPFLQIASYTQGIFARSSFILHKMPPSPS